ncbi:MAG: PAS domain S-box protein [Synergistetes bacterium]|nr:PAS domain S-box protein [Synergistota bacterium]
MKKALKRIEERLKLVESKKDFLQKILDVVPVPIFCEDKEGRYIGCNKAYADFMGKSVEEILSKAVTDVVPPEQAEEIFERDKKLISEGGFISEERKILHHDGTYHTVILNKTVFTDDAGDPIGLIGAFLDITEIIEAREKERQYLKKLQCLASAISLAREKERQRVAKEIHDSIGQNLALSKLRLQMLHAGIKSKEIRKQIEDIIEVLNESIQITKDLTFDLGIPVLYQLGLEATLSWLSDKFYSKYGVEVKYTYGNLSKKFPMELEAFLVRAVQELLTNVVKHAKTDFAEVKVDLKDENTIKLEVRDYGCGFDISAVEEGYGIFSLQETVKLLGGRMEICSMEGEGTVVYILVPIKAFEEGNADSA